MRSAFSMSEYHGYELFLDADCEGNSCRNSLSRCLTCNWRRFASIGEPFCRSTCSQHYNHLVSGESLRLAHFSYELRLFVSLARLFIDLALPHPLRPGPLLCFGHMLGVSYCWRLVVVSS